MIFSKYESLEQFRASKTLRFGDDPVVLLEKIHGANAQFYLTTDPSVHDSGFEGVPFTAPEEDRTIDGTTHPAVNIVFGKRTNWVLDKENFFNHTPVVKSYLGRMTHLYTLIRSWKGGETRPCVRVFGEIYGGLYKKTTSPGCKKIQNDTAYCPHNDFAVFDIIVDDVVLHWDVVKDLCQTAHIHTTPEIARGQLSTILKSFDVESLMTRVPMELHGLEDPNSPAEGVVIKSLAAKPTKDQLIGMKLKQTRMLERPTKKVRCTEVPDYGLYSGYMNQNRFDCYRSKVGDEAIMNRRQMGVHLKALVTDAVQSIMGDYEDIEPEVLKGIRKVMTPIAKKMIMDFDVE